MQVRLFSKAARNYLNQKTTCQFRTIAISSSSSTRCLSSGSKLSKDEWRKKIKYFKAHVVLSFSSHALFYILYSFTLMLGAACPSQTEFFISFPPFSFFSFFLCIRCFAYYLLVGLFLLSSFALMLDVSLFLLDKCPCVAMG